jgi:hypothetical protein
LVLGNAAASNYSPDFDDRDGHGRDYGAAAGVVTASNKPYDATTTATLANCMLSG